MKVRLIDSNVVVVATHFNPSIFSQLWLTKHGIATEAEVEGAECAFTNVLMQIINERYALLVTANNLQISVKPIVDNQQDFIASKIAKVIDLLPETPYNALGINFIYICKPEVTSVNALTKELFFVRQSPLHRVFNSPDARFGGYASKDVHGFRMKLDAKPIIALFDETSTPEDLFLLSFNFHLDIPKDNAGEAIKNAIDKWNANKAEAQQIVDTIKECDK